MRSNRRTSDAVLQLHLPEGWPDNAETNPRFRFALYRGRKRTTGVARLADLDRARTVASSLDVRGARVDEALEVVERYLEDASLAGLERATIIHGLGTGALRDAVRSSASAHPLVRSVRAGERGEGGDGATVVIL